LPVYRCDWCGRFYSSPLPDGSACQNHIIEHNERLTASIVLFNKRLALNAPVYPTAIHFDKAGKSEPARPAVKEGRDDV
jgi:hypothetical protein